MCIRDRPREGFAGSLFDTVETAAAEPVNVQQEPLLTLYDLFGFRDVYKRQEITCFEKDPATGLILKHLHPDVYKRQRYGSRRFHRVEKRPGEALPRFRFPLKDDFGMFIFFNWAQK